MGQEISRGELESAVHVDARASTKDGAGLTPTMGAIAAYALHLLDELEQEKRARDAMASAVKIALTYVDTDAPTPAIKRDTAGVLRHSLAAHARDRGAGKQDNS